MCAAAVHKAGHVALRVLQIEILRAVALHHIYHSLPRCLIPVYAQFALTLTLAKS